MELPVWCQLKSFPSAIQVVDRQSVQISAQVSLTCFRWFRVLQEIRYSDLRLLFFHLHSDRVRPRARAPNTGIIVAWLLFKFICLFAILFADCYYNRMMRFIKYKSISQTSLIHRSHPWSTSNIIPITIVVKWTQISPLMILLRNRNVAIV